MPAKAMPFNSASFDFAQDERLADSYPFVLSEVKGSLSKNTQHQHLTE